MSSKPVQILVVAFLSAIVISTIGMAAMIGWTVGAAE